MHCLVLIAQAVFLLEHGQMDTHRQTDKVTDAIDHGRDASVTGGLHNNTAHWSHINMKILAPSVYTKMKR